MAVVVRCSSLLRRPNSAAFDRFSSPCTQFPLNGFRLGNMGSIHCKLKKLFSFVGNAAKEELEAYLASVGRQAMPMGVDDVKTSIPEGTRVGHTQLYDDSYLEHIFAHQVMVPGRSPALTLVIVNALMFSTPLEALAETYKADKSLFILPLLLFAAFLVATIGVLLLRSKKEKLKQMNEQLRQRIAILRREAKITSLESGNNVLRNQDPDKAFVEFKAALELAQRLADPTAEMKAASGLGASLQMQGKYLEAIKYYSMVLAISKRKESRSKKKRNGEDFLRTDAYRAFSAIVDCYTKLGYPDKAKAYDYVNKIFFQAD